MSSMPQVINYNINASAFYPSVYEGGVSIAHKLKEKGHQVFFVGGCVRDVLIGIRPKEIDLATSATPDEIKKMFKNVVLVGEKFGVSIINIGDNEYHVSTFREDEAYIDGRHPTGVKFSGPEQDANRRDFTINALFWEPIDSKLYDYTGGLNDLNSGIIRAVGEPLKRFTEDKLRILRCARFAAHLGFAIDRDTYDAITQIKEPVSGVSKERIRDEFEKIFKAKSPSIAFEFLYQLNVLKNIVPELCSMKNVPQPKEYHPEGDVWTHTMLALDLAAKEASEKDSKRLLMWSILLHDVGKPKTITYPKDDKDRIRFNGHDAEGAKFARAILENLRLSNKDTDDICKIIGNHMRYGKASEIRKGRLRFLMEQDGDLFESEMDLNYFDAKASHGDLSNWKYLKSEFEAFKNQKSFPKALVDGAFLISIGMKPSSDFSLIIEKAREAQLEGCFKDEKGAKAFVKKIISSLIK